MPSGIVGKVLKYLATGVVEFVHCGNTKVVRYELSITPSVDYIDDK